MTNGIQFSAENVGLQIVGGSAYEFEPISFQEMFFLVFIQLSKTC